MSCHSGYRVPYTITEWNRVRLLFKSSRMHELRECLAILSMWRSRMGDSTPVAISCSDLLVRVAIEELLIESSDEKWMKIEALKMQHCIAIIRCVDIINKTRSDIHYYYYNKKF
uniref:Uncharacterized protein n=1 Tax=Heterorhabditis bacteriophora TaxID=37862 RepID=A0A1I7XND3_HETBA